MEILYFNLFHFLAPTGNYTNVTIHSIGVSHFTIKWEDLNMYKRNDLILGYYVCVRVSSSNNECDRANTERYTPGTTTPFQLRKTGLLPYTEYTVVIRAFNSKGYGPYSPSVFATTGIITYTYMSIHFNGLICTINRCGITRNNTASILPKYHNCLYSWIRIFFFSARV